MGGDANYLDKCLKLMQFSYNFKIFLDQVTARGLLTENSSRYFKNINE
jgi:hypothetical protein